MGVPVKSISSMCIQYGRHSCTGLVLQIPVDIATVIGMQIDT